MKKQIAPLGRKEELVVQDMNGEVLIYDLKENKAFCLNETSAMVWQLCNGENSVSDISQSIGKKLNSPANEDLVWLALDQLKKENLIANSEEIVPDFNGMSRREVIRKVGLGTMIALPLVSSLIAPTAAQAGSPGNGTLGTRASTCTNATTCSPGLVGNNCATATCPQQTTANPLATVNVGFCLCVATSTTVNGAGVTIVTAAACASVITCNTVTSSAGLVSTTTATLNATGAVVFTA